MLYLHGRLSRRLLLAVLVLVCGVWSGSADADEKPQAEDAAGAAADPLNADADETIDAPEEIDEEQANGPSRDNIDARASSDPQLTNELNRAARHVEREDWHAAIGTLQPLLGDHADTLCRDAEGGWISLRAEVEAQIGRMPDAGLEAYRSLYEGLAAEMLSDGGGLSDCQACTEVASRYFHTRAGNQAANALALHHFDSGQFIQSAYWFSRLLEVDTAPQPAESNEWRMLAAYAFHRAGHSDVAAELLQSVQITPESTVTRIRELIQEPSVAPASPFALLDNWPMLYGSADHLGLVEEGDPLLLQRWSTPLTARHAIHSQVEDLLLDLFDNNRPPIPAWQPIMVDGKVAFRTMRGLAVADLQTGEPLWESTIGVSAERLLSGELNGGAALPASGARPIVQYGVDQQDNHQLASLLFRDATYGLLSSDGRLLYSIEQHALMAQSNYGYWWSNIKPSDQDPYRRDWSTNQLVAFDLATGRRVWEVGGRRMDEPFDPPLAGSYLFGPPVPSGEELFVIGEQDGEIQLFVLKSATGELLWTLPLAGVTKKIEYDWVRRQWAAQPAVDAGLVICPTTVGWLVAVDWRQQRIRWAHRYAARSESTLGRRVMMNTQQPIGMRWCQSAPIMAGGRVLFTPSEQPDESNEDQPRLICLDVLTGDVQWERAKGAGLYVAGVVGEAVVIVERSAVVGVSLTDGGRELWSAALPSGAMPSGRGVLFADRLLLPLHSGEVVTIDVQDGEVLGRQSAPDPGLLPGNLAIHAGTLVSLGPRGLDAFELRDSVAAEIARRRLEDPADAWATVREAEVYQSSEEFDRALELLDRAETQLQESDQDLIERHHRRTFDCLLRMCQDEPGGREAEFERLATVADTDRERFDVAHLDARRHLVRGDLPGAFEVYWQLIDAPGPEFVQTEDVRCRRDMWLSGRLEDVWTAAEAKVRDRMDARIDESIDDALSADAAERSRWERLLGFHAGSWRVTWSLIESAIDRGEFAPAEVRLRRLLVVDDLTIAAGALNRLGELLNDFGQSVDAAACFVRLEHEFADVELEDGRSGAEHAAAQFETSGLSRELLAPQPVGIWSNLEFEIENRRAESGRAIVQPITRSDDGAEFFRQHRFDFEPGTQQFVISPTGTATPYWSTPLRMMAQPQSYNQSVSVAGYGLQAVVFHRGVLHALSMPDRKVLWTEPVDRVGLAYTRHVVTQTVSPMQTASRFLANSALIRRSPQHGMLAHACPTYVARYGRREVRVLDPLTGELLWMCSGIAPQTTIFGDDHAIYLTAGNGSTRVMRATDGRILEIPGLEDLVENAVAWGPQRSIIVERSSEAEVLGVRRSRVTVRAVNPGTSESLWSLNFEDNARLALIDDEFLVVLEPSGASHIVDFATEESVHLGTLPDDIMEAASQVHVVADSEYVYFLVDHLPNQTYSHVNPPVVRVNGTVFVLRRKGGGIAWQRQVDSQNLLLTQFEHSPLLVFLSYQSKLEEALRFSYFQVRVLAMDKQTGRVVAELDQPMPNGGVFYQMQLDMANRAFSIRSHNRRIRIRAVDELTTTEP